MDASLYPKVTNGSRTEQVAVLLTDLITSQQLATGDFLPSETELCSRLGVSRATIRQALRTLEVRGLVVTKHGVGVQVTDKTRDVVIDSIRLMLLRGDSGPRDLLEVRQILERQTAALAAVRATDDDINALRGCTAVMRDELTTIDDYVAADLNFHLCLAEASKNTVLASLTHAIRSLLREAITATYAVDGQTERRLRDHTRILDAIVANDPAAADKAMQDHLGSTEEMLRQLGLLQSADKDEDQVAGVARQVKGVAAHQT